MSSKRCPECGEEKERSEFYKNRSKKEGLNRECKICSNARVREWVKNNPNKRKAFVKKYNSANKIRAAEYYQSHKAELSARQRACRKANPEKEKEYWHNRRARKAAGGRFTAVEWLALKEFHHFTCLKCGKKEPEIKLTPDHVLPLSKGGRNSIDNIQPLCKSCNCKKYTKHIDYRPGATTGTEPRQRHAEAPNFDANPVFPVTGR